MRVKVLGFILISLIFLVGCTQPYATPTSLKPSYPPTIIPSTKPQSPLTATTPVQKPTTTSTSNASPTPTTTLTPSPIPKPQEYKVIRIIDGDTIEVDISGVIFDVRYIGIDTPEITDNRQEYYSLAKEATEYNGLLVGGKSVRLEKDVRDTDTYGRLLRYVFVGDVFVNAELVRMGFAWTKPYDPDVGYKSYLESMEAEARQSKRGTWALGANVIIKYICFTGNEYVEITNVGGQPQNLGGWVLKDISDGGPYFTFPSYILASGKSIRVYTSEIDPEIGGFSFRYSGAIWNNSEPDTAALFDNNGKEVSRRSY